MAASEWQRVDGKEMFAGIGWQRERVAGGVWIAVCGWQRVGSGVWLAEGEWLHVDGRVWQAAR